MRLTALDRTFLIGETRASMMHVGVLAPFSPPDHPPADFFRSVLDELKELPKACPPWTQKLRFPDLVSSPLQSWVDDDDFDVDYHVRRSALPSPGGERELGILVSRLHSNRIDFHRPPWEVHFIEGLEGGRVAIYFKVHHALVDGFTGMRLLMRSLSTDPAELDTPLFFTRPPPERPPRPEDAPPTLDALVGLLRDQLGATRHVGHAAMNLWRASRKQDDALVAPLQAPRSVLNRKISRNRRFATQRLDAERLRGIAHARGGKLNDAVLALTGAALRRFLLELGALPDDAMTAMVPVNVRAKDDPGGGGNAVGAILASFATDVADPVARLDAVIASTRRGKEQLEGMSKGAAMQYAALLLSPMLLSQLPWAAGRVRPAFNVVVSNVPGSESPLYFRGWRCEAVYPVSIPFHGFGLNVTVCGYAGELDFGFTGCRDTVPHLQRLAVYLGEAARELEDSVAGR